jgi:predicted nucleotidyltransferase
MAKLLQLVPFIRCVILNGSMAEDKIKRSSDIDLLIITKRRRIFTCRTAVLFWAYVSGLKRSADEKESHAGRFCFNYFLTDNFLTIPHNRGEKMDHYCAENYSKSKLIWGNEEIFTKYMTTNLVWMKKYLPQVSLHGADPLYVGNIKLFIWKAKILEYILRSSFGDWIERILKNIQVKKIERDPRAKKYPQLIVFSDKELRFHPPKI